MNIGERIKEVRKAVSMNQADFGKAIGVGLSAVSAIEIGKNNPSEQTIRAICQEFGVRRGWLEHGEGPMRKEPATDDELIDEILADDSEFVRAVIRGIAKMPGGWEKMRETFLAIQAELDKEKKPEA